MTYAPQAMTLATPIGTILLQGNETELTGVTIGVDAGVQSGDDLPTDSPVMRAAEQLREYFAGQRQDFDLPLARLKSARGQALRAAIASLPYGHTMTYGALAKLHDSGPRAVGQACRRNPFPVIIPCHRVTSSAGPEYYSGGSGVDTKAWLNAFERSSI